MPNAQTVNVIGAIKTTASAAEMEATGLALSLYRQHFGTLPVKVEGAPVPLDMVAAFTADRSALTVAIVNPTAESHRLKVDLQGVAVSGRGRRFILTGADRLAHNAPGGPRGVTVTETSLSQGGDVLDSPRLSVVLHVLPLR